MHFHNSALTRTFKIVEENNFSTDDLQWLKSLLNVSDVTRQKKTVRVSSESADAIGDIITSIGKKFCNSATPKLSQLF